MQKFDSSFIFSFNTFSNGLSHRGNFWICLNYENWYLVEVLSLKSISNCYLVFFYLSTTTCNKMKAFSLEVAVCTFTKSCQANLTRKILIPNILNITSFEVSNVYFDSENFFFDLHRLRMQFFFLFWRKCVRLESYKYIIQHLNFSIKFLFNKLWIY